MSAGADAATFHIYCPFDETNNASSTANLASHLAQVNREINTEIEYKIIGQSLNSKKAKGKKQS